MTPDGMIRPGTESPFDFTVDVWTKDSYIWREGNRVLMSLMLARKPRTGAFGRLVKNIEASGLFVAVPTPLGTMQSVLDHMGFVPHMEVGEHGGCEVWMRPGQAETFFADPGVNPCPPHRLNKRCIKGEAMKYLCKCPSDHYYWLSQTDCSTRLTR